jgi:hypothetical protein
MELNRRTFLASALAPAFATGAEPEPVARYTVGNWPLRYGNHRARLNVRSAAARVAARIPWRRHDEVTAKEILVVEAATNQQVADVEILSLAREACELAFAPPAAGEYHVYYMPFTVKPVPHQYRTTYTPSTRQATGRSATGLPQARFVDLQARTDFDRFDPMEIAATGDEMRALAAAHAAAPFLVFAEHRQHPVRMTRFLPQRWIGSGPVHTLDAEAAPNEFFVFQIAVWAPARELYPVKLAAEGPFAFHAFNLKGRDWLGHEFTKKVGIPAGRIQTFWCGLDVARGAASGTTRVVIEAGGHRETVEVHLRVAGGALEDRGDAELWRLSRLRWLNSEIGAGDAPTAPFTALTVEGATTGCLNRTVTFGASGLPAGIRSNGVEVLAAPIRLALGEEPANVETRVLSATAGAVEHESRYRAGAFEVRCHSRMEFDGHIAFRIALRSTRAVDAPDIAVEIPVHRRAADYLMGMGFRGGRRPAAWDWKWNVNQANNGIWIGAVEAGLMCKLKGLKDVWELLDLRASGVPENWNNTGRGGCTVREQGDTVLLRAFTGPRAFRANEELVLRFSLLVTPVKPLDAGHWGQRYFHIYDSPDAALAKGATIINVHHGYEINPHINYPFLTADKMAAYVNEAHGKGLKVKIYYTVRELSTRLPELWALRSLGSEVFQNGPGNGHAWLCEHLEERYQPAWHHIFPDGEVDASIATTGLSRWHNYYLEGLSWLVRNVGIDGIYIDGVGYDREVMKRVRRVLDAGRAGCLIDFHSGNSYDYENFRVSPAVAYMEHFPYMDSLWFGEGYDYNRPPDYWLTEISGLPFGLFSEMLERNGNPWRGMLYGMTARYYSGANPRPIWELWDRFAIAQARMLGYWDRRCPVRTGRDGVLATAYVKPGQVLISLASWAPERVECRLELDFAAASLTAPAIEGFQEARQFAPGEAIPVEAGRGWLLLAKLKR